MIPFTREQFFEVFAAYNGAVWPTQLALYALALGLVAAAASARRRPQDGVGRRIGALGLGALWIWCGVGYQWWWFTTVNRMAWIFGALFVLQGALFVGAGLSHADPLAIGPPRGRRGWIGAGLIAYALIVYPLLGTIGHPLREVPSLGVPCPTTIFTYGLLFWSVRAVRPHLLAIPFLWSLVGSSAAILFGVVQDGGLLVAALLGFSLLRPPPASAAPSGAAAG